MFDEGFVLDLFVETSLIGLFIFKFSSEGGQKKTITDQKENDWRLKSPFFLWLKNKHLE